MAKRVTATGPVEGPWALPADWQWERLGSFVSKGGTSVTPARTPDDVFQLYSVPSHPSGYPESVFGREIGSTKQTIAAGDVLLCKINPRINRIWKVVDHETGRLIASTEWIRFAPDDRVDPDYLRYFLMRQEVREYLAMNASGVGGSLMRVRPSVVEPLPFPLAPKDHQRRIVARIDDLFAEIDDGEAALARARDDLATWRKALLKAAVTGELTADWRATHSGAATGPSSTSTSYPRQWTRTTIGKLASLQGGPAFKSSDYSLNGTFLVRIGDITDGLVTASPQSARLPNGFRDENARFIVQAGDILIAMSGATTAKFGRYNGAEPALLNQRVGRFKIAEKAMLSADYLAIWLGHQQGKILAAAYGGAQPNISSGAIEAMSIDLPPAAEQAEIVSRIQSSLGQVSERSADLRELAPASSTLRQSILAAAFRGELA